MKDFFIALLPFLLQLFLFIISGVLSLSMEGVVVPSYVLQGESAELRCQFTLDQDNLYSVTWYKDHEEFYRYVPKNNPRQHMYKLDGAKVDQQRSDAQVVRLRGTKPAASGVYRCEVSAEAPSFTSVSGEGRMDVVSLPEEDPEISGDIFPRDYREGDLLTLNCTAGRSHPPARIRWFINDRQVPAWFESTSNNGGEKGASAGLKLRLSHHHFNEGLLAVKCVATVGAPPPLLDTKETFFMVKGSADFAKFHRSLHLLYFILILKLFCQY